MNNKTDNNTKGQDSKFIRDPLHEFIKISQDEQKIVDSKPFQRLRDINQLSFTHLVYPGATHKRFEHSLGVMHLAGKIFDTLFGDMSDEELKKQFGMSAQKGYWRQVLRIAALCHDMGHLPFSHTLECLLEDDLSHEDLSKQIIVKDLKDILKSIKIIPEDVSYIATWKDKKQKSDSTSDKDTDVAWKQILSRIITNDLFGADRVDYIIRDAYHAGVPYGNIDIPQLLRAIKSIDKLLIDPDADGKNTLHNVKEGDKAMLASFLMSRQLMYSLVYQHPVCKVYDMHLVDFVKDLKEEEEIETVKSLIYKSDAHLLSILKVALDDKNSQYHHHARRILGRQHFKLIKELDSKRVSNLSYKFMSMNANSDKQKNRVDIFCEGINKEFDRKVVSYQRRTIESGEQISDSSSGYDKLLEVLQKGDFSYCYIYVERGMEEKIENFIKKLDKSN